MMWRLESCSVHDARASLRQTIASKQSRGEGEAARGEVSYGVRGECEERARQSELIGEGGSDEAELQHAQARERERRARARK